MTVPLSVSNMALISFRQRAPSTATVIVGIKKKETRKERVAIITRGEEKKKKKKCNECILYVKQETNKKIKRRK